MASRLVINQNFARRWFGQAVSQVGDFVFDTTAGPLDAPDGMGG